MISEAMRIILAARFGCGARGRGSGAAMAAGSGGAAYRGHLGSDRKFPLWRTAGKVCNVSASYAYHRRNRDPAIAPTDITTRIASTYQVATKSGESSGQCVA